MLDAELVEDADHGAAQVLAPGRVLRAGDRGDQRVEAALLLAVVERRERRAQLLVVLQPQPGGEALGREAAGELGQDRQRVVALAAVGEDAGERQAGVGAAGSSSSARRRSSSPPASTSASASDGSSASRKRATAGGGCAPVNSETISPSLNALTAGMPWIRNAAARRGFASVSSLASATLPARSLTACSSTGVSCRHGPHHAAQKSTTTGQLVRARR